MPVIEMYRNGDIAFVNTDHAPTYENFLAHGWTLELPKPPEAPKVSKPAKPAKPEVTDGE